METAHATTFGREVGEGTALLGAIQMVADTGHDARVYGGAGDCYWHCEPDTKVDEEDRYFPVIVHYRGPAR
jgi:hypothetical protein